MVVEYQFPILSFCPDLDCPGVVMTIDEDSCACVCNSTTGRSISPVAQI